MTPREPDRYEAKAKELCLTEWRPIAAALRAVEAETLERAAQFVDDEDEGRTGRGFELGDVGDFRKRCVAGIRALASPAAAPAAEPELRRTVHGEEDYVPGEPSEPAAPAPDLRRVVERAQVELNQRDARIVALEAALRELTRAATEHANAHGCSGDLGARLSDAKALLAARTSARGAGEGTT